MLFGERVNMERRAVGPHHVSLAGSGIHEREQCSAAEGVPLQLGFFGWPLRPAPGSGLMINIDNSPSALNLCAASGASAFDRAARSGLESRSKNTETPPTRAQMFVCL